MILYFSGTGNSRYISEVINSILNDEIVCINDYLKNNQFLDTFFLLVLLQFSYLYL